MFGRPQVAVLREAMELLRGQSPDRDTVLSFVRERVRSLFPGVRSRAMTDLYADWGRRIHTPVEVERRRVFPQQLLHDLLAACDFAGADLDDGAAADIGVLSRLLQDVETVYRQHRHAPEVRRHPELHAEHRRERLPVGDGRSGAASRMP